MTHALFSLQRLVTSRVEGKMLYGRKRSVLRLDLNMDREEVLQRDEGNAFQTVK